jgi:hypothetical protein
LNTDSFCISRTGTATHWNGHNPRPRAEDPPDPKTQRRTGAFVSGQLLELIGKQEINGNHDNPGVASGAARAGNGSREALCVCVAAVGKWLDCQCPETAVGSVLTAGDPRLLFEMSLRLLDRVQ